MIMHNNTNHMNHQNHPMNNRLGNTVVSSTIASSTHQGGFTLIEVLVAIVVTAVGLLGVAGLQVVGMRTNQSAYLRTQATTLAYDMADRLRANTNSAVRLTYPTPTTPVVSYPLQGIVPQQNAQCANTTGCNFATMAAHDYAQWLNDIATLLPGDSTTPATGVICIDSTPNDGTQAAPQCDNVIAADNPRNPLYAIKVWWVDYDATAFVGGTATGTGTTWRRFVANFTVGPRNNEFANTPP